jgi:hypothetical protein
MEKASRLTIHQAAFIGVGAMVGAGIFSLLGAAGDEERQPHRRPSDLTGCPEEREDPGADHGADPDERGLTDAQRPRRRFSRSRRRPCIRHARTLLL